MRARCLWNNRYCVYVASFLCYSHTQNQGGCSLLSGIMARVLIVYLPGFSIFAGALLGVCAGLLWTAQGAIMMSYPTEDLKGRYISWFWMIFNLGAVIGGLVCNPNNSKSRSKSMLILLRRSH